MIEVLVAGRYPVRLCTHAKTPAKTANGTTIANSVRAISVDMMCLRWSATSSGITVAARFDLDQGNAGMRRTRGVRSRLVRHQDRHRHRAQEAARGAAQHEFPPSRVAVTAHGDEVGSGI